MIPVHALGPNPYIYPITSTHLQAGIMFPDHLRISLISITLAHRMNRMGHGLESNALAETLYEHRGIMIRSLNEDIGVESRRTSDTVMAGIMTLLLSDVRRCSTG